VPTTSELTRIETRRQKASDRVETLRTKMIALGQDRDRTPTQARDLQLETEEARAVLIEINGELRAERSTLAPLAFSELQAMAPAILQEIERVIRPLEEICEATNKCLAA